MRLVMILTAIFFLQGCHPFRDKDPDPVKVEAPKNVSRDPRGNIVLKVTGDNKIFAGDKELPLAKLDSMLAIEIDKKRLDHPDTITVVIDADKAAEYGVVFQIVKAARKQQVKVVASVGD